MVFVLNLQVAFEQTGIVNEYQVVDNSGDNYDN